jgi:hypothetical protein
MPNEQVDGLETAAAGACARAFHGRGDWLAMAFLASCVVLLHSHGLRLGFWFDDHIHLELCQQNGFQGLASGNRFDWTRQLMRVWWAQRETGWAQFRPLTVALRVVLLRLFGLDPLPFHVVHLTLCMVSVLLLYGLLRYCGMTLVAAVTACLFFTLHPSNALTAAWLANDGQVLVGLWTVVGLWLIAASARSGHRRLALLAGIFSSYLLAMCSRENGIMLGPMLVLFDALRTRQVARPGEALARTAIGHRWQRCALYLALTFEGIAFLPLRSLCLGTAPLPGPPYFHWPSEPGFMGWLPYKVLHDAVCLPLGLPFVPIAAVQWLQDRPAVSLAAVLAVVGLTAVFFFPLRRSRAMWGVVAGTTLAVAPTLLVFSAPYNFYLAAAGWAVLLALWSQRLWATRPRLVAGTLLALASCYLLGLWAGTWTVHSAADADRCVRRDVLATDLASCPPPTRLFFINLPFFAADVGPGLRLATGRADLEVYPLTFAPDLFVSCSPLSIEIEDERTLLLQAPARSWFAGNFGELVQLAWFGTSRSDLNPGPLTIHAAAGLMPFRVEVVRANSQGISALRFVFDRPLDDPHYRFFVGTPSQCAQLLSFHRNESSSPQTKLGEKGARPALVLVADPGAYLPAPSAEVRRLRRMQSAYDRCTGLLMK